MYIISNQESRIVQFLRDFREKFKIFIPMFYQTYNFIPDPMNQFGMELELIIAEIDGREGERIFWEKVLKDYKKDHFVIRLDKERLAELEEEKAKIIHEIKEREIKRNKNKGKKKK